MKEKVAEKNNVYTFILEKAPDVNWKAGQHGIFEISHKKIKKATRPFSVASTPREGKIQISMQITDTPSDFKQAMYELEPGMTMNMRGPIGPMYFNAQEKNNLIIAGGLGITPFRAMLKDLQLSKSDIKCTLLYMDSTGAFLYKSELDNIVENSEDIEVQYLQQRDLLFEEITQYTTKQGNDSQYFIAGSKKMVQSISDLLKTNNIKKSKIKKDSFRGYKG
ncbi:FAD-dependent oxidoreductase [Alkalihalobacillus sp. 1P02AB]|uniref:FAD-dependent oxidoreductase n=1 Tax=Alkalihalobacillus sp. 1P02AB TaxID=3132260 RepID=UPI0039A71690